MHTSRMMIGVGHVMVLKIRSEFGIQYFSLSSQQQFIAIAQALHLGVALIHGGSGKGGTVSWLTLVVGGGFPGFLFASYR